MPPLPVQLRPATAADADAIVRVHFAAVHGTASNYYSAEIVCHWAAAPDDEQRRAATREAVARGDESFIVAQSGGVIVGFGSIVPTSAELRAVYVDPSFGGRGVGSVILRRLEALASSLGISTLRMDASINAEGFYSKHGYSRVRRGVHLLAGGIEMPCVTMSKGINRQCGGPEPRV